MLREKVVLARVYACTCSRLTSHALTDTENGERATIVAYTVLYRATGLFSPRCTARSDSVAPLGIQTLATAIGLRAPQPQSARLDRAIGLFSLRYMPHLSCRGFGHSFPCYTKHWRALQAYEVANQMAGRGSPIGTAHRPHLADP